jgi:hypothetical protein
MEVGQGPIGGCSAIGGGGEITMFSFFMYNRNDINKNCVFIKQDIKLRFKPIRLGELDIGPSKHFFAYLKFITNTKKKLCWWSLKVKSNFTDIVISKHNKCRTESYFQKPVILLPHGRFGRHGGVNMRGNCVKTTLYDLNTNFNGGN